MKKMRESRDLDIRGLREMSSKKVNPFKNEFSCFPRMRKRAYIVVGELIPWLILIGLAVVFVIIVAGMLF